MRAWGSLHIYTSLQIHFLFSTYFPSITTHSLSYRSRSRSRLGNGSRSRSTRWVCACFLFVVCAGVVHIWMFVYVYVILFWMDMSYMHAFLCCLRRRGGWMFAEVLIHFHFGKFLHHPYVLLLGEVMANFFVEHACLCMCVCACCG